MGILDKLLGRGDDTPSARHAFSVDTARPALSNLIEALAALADAMDVDDAPMSNPGWRGRVRDLRNARGELRLIARRPEFTRDDVFEVLTTVRPLFRGQPPQAYAHLAKLNDRVIVAIDEVHAAC